MIPAGQGRDENSAKLVGALIEQGVEVYRLDNELTWLHGEQVTNRLRRYDRTHDSAPRGITIGSDNTIRGNSGRQLFHFSQSALPRRTCWRLFEPQLYPDRITATGEAERPYDVAGWTLPMMMGLQARTGHVNPRTGQPNDN